jgi:hypothetical protein
MPQAKAPRGRSTRRSAGPVPYPAALRLRDSFIAALAADYEAHGAAAIAALRVDRPQDYVKLVATLLGRDGLAGGEGEEDDAIPVAIEVRFVSPEG